MKNWATHLRTALHLHYFMMTNVVSVVALDGVFLLHHWKLTVDGNSSAQTTGSISPHYGIFLSSGYRAQIRRLLISASPTGWWSQREELLKSNVTILKPLNKTNLFPERFWVWYPYEKHVCANYNPPILCFWRHYVTYSAASICILNAVVMWEVWSVCQ